MRYKMQSLDSHSGIVELINYHLQHIMYKCLGSPRDTGLVLNCRPFEPTRGIATGWISVFIPPKNQPK